MKYVIGIDLGTSAVKTMLVDQQGEVVAQVAKPYPLIQTQSGYSEQDPEEWVNQTVAALTELVSMFDGNPKDIEGISYSGQMHGLVLLNSSQEVLRKAILWNDTRTTPQCEYIMKEYAERILSITKNRVLEGFTLPKILWVKEHEPNLFKEASIFLLPKDYLRFRMTGMIHSEYSDAAGTLLLDLENRTWSKEICELFEIDEEMCPPLVQSHSFVGNLLPEIANSTGLPVETKVFAGGADNACGAIGAGVLTETDTLCSIGTSGVILSYEKELERDYKGKVHFFNHGHNDSFYSMGVTLSAGQSLAWFKETFASKESFEELMEGVESIPAGSGGLIFTPYLYGERTPHADADIRASFLGMEGTHRREHFVRAVMEGITFSLNESIEVFRQEGKKIDKIISIGGGAKNDVWLQMQADIFNARVLKLKSEQGPGLGAAMLAAIGVGWFQTLEECADSFIHISTEFVPNHERVVKYKEIFSIYQMVYSSTKEINKKLKGLRS